jgi:hypothetical protein
MVSSAERGCKSSSDHGITLALVWPADAAASDHGVFSAAGFLAASLSCGILFLIIDEGQSLMLK